MIERDLVSLSATASDIEGRMSGIDKKLSKLLELRLGDSVGQIEFEEARRRLIAEKEEEARKLAEQQNAVTRSMSYLDQELTKCVRAHEYTLTPDEALLGGMAQTLSSDIRFVPGGVKIQPQEPLREIIRFTPLILGSVSRETSDFRHTNCNWGAFCGHLHTVARMNGAL
jgi:hypothetical protein